MNYGNSCEANAQSASVASEGECAPEECANDQVEVMGQCLPGCMGDNDCPRGLTCNAADVCLPPPAAAGGGAAPAVCYGWCADH